jgi:asparagine N-glycosylation enzyme membrane subunit Stt3
MALSGTSGSLHSGTAPSPSPTTSPSPSPSSGEAIGAGGAEALVALVWFGVFAIVVGCAIYALVVLTGKAKGITFIRLYALVVIAVLAAMLAVTNVTGEAKAAAFTLLGTIAGYLAGKRDETTTRTTPAQGQGGATVTTEPAF